MTLAKVKTNLLPGTQCHVDMIIYAIFRVFAAAISHNICKLELKVFTRYMVFAISWRASIIPFCDENRFSKVCVFLPAMQTKRRKEEPRFEIRRPAPHVCKRCIFERCCKGLRFQSLLLKPFWRCEKKLCILPGLPHLHDIWPLHYIFQTV